MGILQAIVLGLVGGLTEFLPVSSNGHLVLASFIAGWKQPSLAFAVAVRLGALGAMTYALRSEIGILLRAGFDRGNASPEQRKTLRLIGLATIPAAVGLVAIRFALGDAPGRPVLTAILLGVTGYFLVSTETATEFEEGSAHAEAAISEGDATAVGVALAVAALPGVSRTGAAIGEGMRRGLTHSGATRFAFVLAVPVLAISALIDAPGLFHRSGTGAAALGMGVVTAGLSAFFALRWFLGVVGRRGLRPFGAYCFFAMVAGIITALARG